MLKNSDEQNSDLAIDLNLLLLEGVALFNRQEFFECHEVLEDLWNRQIDPEKQFTQGIIQLAVGYYHLLRQNRQGANKLLTRALERLQPFRPVFFGLNVDSLFQSVKATLENMKLNASDEELFSGIPSIEINSATQAN